GLGALGMMFGNIMSENVPDTGSVRFVMDSARYERHRDDKYTINGKPVSFDMVRAEDAEPCDLLLVSVKYPELENALETMASSVDSHTIILSLLNGINSEEIIRERYPENRIIYTVPQGMDAMRSGCSLVFTKHGALHIGLTDDDPGMKKALGEVSEFFDRVKMPYVIEDDILYRMWFKYMLNVGCNQVCMVYGVGYADAIRVGGEPCMVLVAAMREVKEIAARKGIKLTEDDINKVIEMLAGLDPDATPSMGQDRIAGKPSEVDMFAGTVISMGKEYGIMTPANEFLMRRVREIEAEY
ncbi:MAG: ketopantoate reductase family protein, partial [Anaerovoracaceae bacterium]